LWVSTDGDARLTWAMEQHELQLHLLSQLMKVEGNDRCADCKALRPRWANVTLGVFLCWGCSSIHQSLGVEGGSAFSEVRSCTLGKWLPEQVAQMKRVGNTKANAYWEATLRDRPVAVHDPTRWEEHNSTWQAFIRDKYEGRLYVSQVRAQGGGGGFTGTAVSNVNMDSSVVINPLHHAATTSTVSGRVENPTGPRVPSFQIRMPSAPEGDRFPRAVTSGQDSYAAAAQNARVGTETGRGRGEGEAEQIRRLVDAQRARWQQAEADFARSVADAEMAKREAEAEERRWAAEKEQTMWMVEAERARWQQAEAERARREAAERGRQEAEARRTTWEAAVRARREAEAERARQEAEAERLRREAEAERLRREAEAERARREAEAERVRREAEAERARREAEAERARREAEAERARREAEADQSRRAAEARHARLDADPPDRFCCEISGDVMACPVVAKDGRTYDEVHIKAWLQQEVAAGRVGCSPFTREEMSDGDWFVNLALKDEIETWEADGRPALEANDDPRRIIEDLQRRLAEEEAARHRERELAQENLALLEQVLEVEAAHAEPRRKNGVL